MKEMKNELIFISLFGIISGFSGIALSTVDNLLVNQFLGLKDTGIYVTAFFFGTLISLPSKVLRKISGIVLANAWKIEDTKTISTTYEKSTVTQFIIGSILFIGLWINIDTVFAVIPKYAAGKYVILFIALANLIEMFSGVSSMVILSSKHYRMFSMQMLASLIILVGFNILLIPRMGINGAGLTAIITTFSFALVRFTFIRRKFKIQPYSLKHLKILGIAALVLCFNYLIPQIRNHYIDFFVRSSAVTVVFSLLIYFSRTAEDINKIALQIFDKIRKYLPH
jgi:O-antigen/teichoic acid export membrane protein